MRAAQYVRMSTEHQQYSIENQQSAIAQYALQHGMEVVKTYADPARSGLDLAHRPGLRKMLEDVLSTTPGYEAILVYDVSRWGRFQDTDESAYYEFLCKKAGVRVHYCAEPFNSEDESITAALIKSLKRAMAGEYLRELSAKTHAGQCQLAKQGYKQGGAAGYGLRRLMVGRDGSPKCILADGEHKSLGSDRVVYIPGPPEEVAIVRQIYSWYLNDDLSPASIAKLLNDRGVSRYPLGKWNSTAVDMILTHEKYAGSVVFNRRTRKLRASTSTTNPRHLWIVTPDSFDPIVSRAQFLAVRQKRRPMSQRSDEEFLDGLRLVWQRWGKVTLRAIKATPEVPSHCAYWNRFGSLGKAYEAIGYKPLGHHFVASILRHRGLELKRQVIQELCSVFRLAGQEVRLILRGVSISGFGRLGIETSQRLILKDGEVRWRIYPRKDLGYRKVIVVRMTSDFTKILDLVLLDQVPRVTDNCRLSPLMLKDRLKGTSAQIAEAILSHTQND